MKKTQTRREFLHTSASAAAALGLGISGGLGCGGDSSTRNGKQATAPITPFAFDTTLAVTMWEFSWLVRRAGAEKEYLDWDKVLDELAERGYNCIRLDAFPHLIAKGPGGELVETFTVLPQTPLFMWGNHEPVEVEPRAALVEFLGKMKDRGMKAGLSTWFNDDSLHRADTVVTPDDYVRVWQQTLQLLEEANLHDVIAWVDLCNEFPMGKWARGAYPAIFNGANPAVDLLSGAMPWGEETLANVQSYFDESIPRLREVYPHLLYTFSFSGAAIRQNIENIDVSNFDLAEIHIWLSDNQGFAFASGQNDLLLENPGSLETCVTNSPGVYFDERERWLTSLEENILRWKEWAAARDLPLITTEAWGPVNYDDIEPYDDISEWDWVKDVCAEGVRMAVEHGWKGICTNNFCQPHFPSMWGEIDWHLEQTRKIKG